MTAPDVAAFLGLLRCHPDLLHPAIGEPAAADIEDRRLNETHPCLRCGQLAQAAIVVLHPAPRQPPRWLDLCWEHYHWLGEGAL
jgi:hypothetical protein